MKSNPYGLSTYPLDGRTLVQNGIPWKCLLSRVLRSWEQDPKIDADYFRNIEHRISVMKTIIQNPIQYSWPGYSGGIINPYLPPWSNGVQDDDGWYKAARGAVSASHRKHGHWDLTNPRLDS